jgi:hypothetical protein
MDFIGCGYPRGQPANGQLRRTAIHRPGRDARASRHWAWLAHVGQRARPPNCAVRALPEDCHRRTGIPCPVPMRVAGLAGPVCIS